MKRWYLCAVLVLVASLSQAASDEGAEPRDIAVEDSDFGRLAIAGRSGTLGLGGELMLNIFPQLNARFGATFFNLDLAGEFSDVEYDFDLDLLTFPISVDWYPFKNAFHVTGGVIINETDVDLSTRSDASLTFGGVTYSASQLGMVSGDVEFHPR